jgi:hypothetical protein
MLAIGARGLKVKDSPDGRKQLDLEIVAAATGANNEAVASSDRTFSPRMTPDERTRCIRWSRRGLV